MMNRHKKGFTLAEVLITLGIIGVVAALTIPTLLNNYQKTQYVQQFKVAYSMFTQMWTGILQDEGTTDYENTSFLANLPRETGTSTDYQTDDYVNYLEKNLKKYIKIVNVYRCQENDEKCTYQALNKTATSLVPSGNGKFYLANGTTFLVHLYKECEKSTIVNQSVCGWMRLDVNGDKKPNTMGRDVFELYFYNYGVIRPYGSKYYADNFEVPLAYWKTPNSYGVSCSTEETNSQGRGCGARIQDEGWKMNY